jgi:hypothetical protein
VLELLNGFVPFTRHWDVVRRQGSGIHHRDREDTEDSIVSLAVVSRPGKDGIAFGEGHFSPSVLADVAFR